MKCENCGKNEVTFVYQSNINGHVTEKHLCAQCAEKLGYSQQIAAHSQRMMQNFFGGGFLDDFFSPNWMGRMNRMLEDPFDDFFREMPALGAPAPKEEAVQKDDLMGREDQSRFAYLRELNAKKMEMKKAVHKEDFERAAQLRDEIRAMEEAHKEHKD